MSVPQALREYLAAELWRGGLAEQDRARFLQPRNGADVGCRYVTVHDKRAVGSLHPGRGNEVLNVNRHAFEQSGRPAPGARVIAQTRLRECTVCIEQRKRVDLRVDLRNPHQHRVHYLFDAQTAPSHRVRYGRRAPAPKIRRNHTRIAIFINQA